ncbi:MAG: formate--phosphoribosylaminoimidazolecarboxamide ligase [Candidatus Bathyarchaeia archaeon]
MTLKKTISRTLSSYDPRNIKIATICSHSALQIFLGAKDEGFRTLGICTKDRKLLYKAFPRAAPDEFIMVDNFNGVLSEACQKQLRQRNAVVVPHGSFVEYVGLTEFLSAFQVPIFGNRECVKWEGDREKQREWLKRAGLKLPRIYASPKDIDGPVLIKYPGAKGGRGYFAAASRREFERKLGRKDARELTIQEFIAGPRYYPHFFYSPLEKTGIRVGDGRLELMGIDRRIEQIDEAYRGPSATELDFTVSGNLPLVVRESLLPELVTMGLSAVKTSTELFPPGMVGPFSLETIYQPERGFTVFEVSARIVAGTNIYPQGSPYSCYIFEEGMSMGRRIARELRTAATSDRLHKILS